MSKFEFGGSQFSHVEDLHDSIAHAWIGGGVAPTLQQATDVLRNFRREVEIVEGSAGWNLKSKKHGVPGYDRKELLAAVERLHDDLETADANEKLADALGDDFHIANVPCNDRGYRIGRYEDETRNSFVYVGEIPTLRHLEGWIAQR